MIFVLSVILEGSLRVFEHFIQPERTQTLLKVRGPISGTHKLAANIGAVKIAAAYANDFEWC